MRVAVCIVTEACSSILILRPASTTQRGASRVEKTMLYERTVSTSRHLRSHKKHALCTQYDIRFTQPHIGSLCRAKRQPRRPLSEELSVYMSIAGVARPIYPVARLLSGHLSPSCTWVTWIVYLQYIYQQNVCRPIVLRDQLARIGEMSHRPNRRPYKPAEECCDGQ